jgi:hypothetical protein
MSPQVRLFSDLSEGFSFSSIYDFIFDKNRFGLFALWSLVHLLYKFPLQLLHWLTTQLSFIVKSL